MQDGFWIVRVFDGRGYSKNVATFAHIVINVIVDTLVGELCKFYSKERKG